MKLRSLRIHGFKSFADRTTIEFREGVTAIIGSNGCGKSNVADAIRWVLGEQRASAMRSAKMDDVIFQGSVRRRPLNFAEVSLLFGNEQGRVPIPQTEIEVTRKTFREGGSEYALNRTACRLRDIHGLLRDTGLGSNAYSIIEAGMIETLLSDRAEERRVLFEEAAGVGRYKDSRQAASRRLDAAETDLARLGDLIAEVESKTRSLARQRRKAQRHEELQSRRLALDVAVTRAGLDSLRDTLAAGERRRAELDTEERAARAARTEAEAVLQMHRADVALLTQQRAATAARSEEIRSRLDAREREVLVADERRAHSEMRIGELVRERAELDRRVSSLAAEISRLETGAQRASQVMEALDERRASRGDENDALRGAVSAQRAAAENAAVRARALAVEIARAEAARSAAERRHRESNERLGRLEQQEATLSAELAEVAAQAERWSGQLAELQLRLSAAAGAGDQAREAIRVFRGREAAARDALRGAEDRLSRLVAQVAAREAIEWSYEGFSPAVAAIMGARERFPGVHGPLADFFAAEMGREAQTAAIEVHLGALLQALVVDDLAAARRVRHWFREEWKGGGSLLLLPLDAPALTALGMAQVLPWASGIGTPWAELLLADLLVIEADDPLVAHTAGRARVAPGGDLVDARGIVRLAEQAAGEGILARRELLGRLRAEREAAERTRDARLAERGAAAEQLTEAEERAAEAEELRRTIRAELQRADGQAAALQQRQQRLLRDRDDLAETIAALQSGAAEAAAAIAEFDARQRDLSREAQMLDGEAAAAQARLAELESRWEAARDEEAETRVAMARAEADLREAKRRFAAATQSRETARSRMSAIEQEAAQLRASLDGLSGVRQRAGDELEMLRRERDRHSAELAAAGSRIAGLEADLSRETERERAARQREAECSEERHLLELQNAESRSRVERTRERLETEWGRPWDALASSAAPVTGGGPDDWSAEIREIGAQLDALGPVNMLAAAEHEEEERRLSFLLEQRADLVKARDDLTAAIRQINRTAREVFLATFATIRENFHRTFQSLFQGGECDIWLADPEDPLESPVEIQASPRGKKTQRIHLLSGGERTLTALALLFALYLVKPSPFCVLDEIDAPLDESNVGRFIQLLHDFKADTQFIVITHNPRTMEAADWIYGVTMEEPGISSIVGVELQGAWAIEGRVA